MAKKKEYPVFKKVKEVQKYMENRVGAGTSYDVDFRDLIILKTEVQLYYLNGLVDDAIVSQILKVLIEINDNEYNKQDVGGIIQNRLVNESLDIAKNMDEAVDQLLSGLIVIFVDGEKRAFVLDVRSYPGRQPEEPDTERVVRGARDGYTENVVFNTALTRMRIRDERLRNEMVKVGERSKSDVCISYLQDVADNELVELTKKKIQEIDIDGIPMADKTIEEFIVENKWNPFPLVRYTERPDVAAQHILEGHVVVIIDNTPSVLILPTTFFDSLEHAEEYRQTPAVGTTMRWIRIIAILASLYLLPLWLLFVLDPSLLPEKLSFIGPNEEGNIPIFVQILIGIIGVEFLRLAAVHTPTPLATSMGLIAAVLIGEIAIDVGMLSPEVILYVSISTIGNYVTPSYELSVANKLVTTALVLLTAIFKLEGFVIGVLIHILFLTHLKAFKTPYLWPFIPFDTLALMRFLLRIPIPYVNTRPSIIHPKDTYSQPLPEKNRRRR
ncbi:spore germination protein [Virgibacillus sp. MSJ-26]|uniref:spore germination protein n=1 Tax=Virgibacillus sp. MSJ-26 TaxID=2841522 RepID=UPI00273A320F|nr:spore germination protein [Virgibacillus sp. MSJ-26]